MGYIRNLKILLAVTAGISSLTWAQGGRNQAGRGAANQAGAPAAQTGRGGRGAGAAAAPDTGSGEFYNYDPTASAGLTISDSSPVETHQKVTVNGQALAYTARAGYLPLHNPTTGQVEAHVFFTSYTKDGGAEAPARPVMFFLGGAPGVASTWQEFGGLGPKHMASNSAAENPNTLLAQADLVFVNPVGTAFSRPDQPGKGPNFWTTTGDIASLGAFVRAYIDKYNRQDSPLFLAGDDFGTGRVAGLASYLHEHQVPVRGVVLLSMTESADALAGDTQYLTLMPSLIMAAWHHKKLSAEMNGMSAEQIAGQARQFASREYLHALYKGDRMTADERGKAIADIARLTGLSKSFVVNNDLRIPLDRFNSELMRDQHLGMSVSDARVTGFTPPPAGGGRGGGGRGAFLAAMAPPIDFATSYIAGDFLNAYQAYLRHELNFNSGADTVYYLMSGGVGPFTSTGADDASLATAFARNPRMRLFVAVNYFDLAAPFYATEFTLAHLNVSPEVRSHNITISHFEAGQMPYIDKKALPKLQKDLAGFVDEATKN